MSDSSLPPPDLSYLGDIAYGLYFLHGLQGPPLSCLAALMLSFGSVTFSWLARVTGYDHDQVHRALDLLDQFGYVIHNPDDTWVISKSILESISKLINFHLHPR